MGPLRTIFFGTPAWAVPSLSALAGAGHDIAAVVTNPDKPTGRKAVLTSSPIKEEATTRGIPILQPSSARDPGLRDELERLLPDAAVVVAYGKILPASLLEVPRLGFLNLHFSLLPAYRGGAPVQRALIDGETETGASIIVLTEGMDEGPVLASSPLRIEPLETAGELGPRLAIEGAALLVPTLEAYASGDLQAVPQDDALATYAPKLSVDDARIDWALPARTIVDLVRGTTPEPGAWTILGDKRVKVFGVKPAGGPPLDPGVLDRSRSGLVVGTGSEPVEASEAQREGGRRVRADEFVRGLRPPGPHAFT